MFITLLFLLLLLEVCIDIIIRSYIKLKLDYIVDDNKFRDTLLKIYKITHIITTLTIIIYSISIIVLLITF